MKMMKIESLYLMIIRIYFKCFISNKLFKKAETKLKLSMAPSRGNTGSPKHLISSLMNSLNVIYLEEQTASFCCNLII